ncbi:CARDB domain-containing protein, partial [Thermococcus sp.]|uniref:CARDB domain-containing protein n=1 Tax=Thermococcus sp. TaxID=35749 RepID=UPI0026283474
GRKIGFGNGFAIDYEIYFWWSGSEGKITADNFNTWTGNGWNYQGIDAVNGSFAYTGNSSTGLKTLEIKIPWSALGGRPEKIGIISWVTGGGGSSAVDSLPVDPAINYSDINSEWTDTDIFTNLAVIAVGPKKIDGNLSDWSANEFVPSKNSGLAGANLDGMYVSWDNEYLYIALKTNNTASWDVAYGVGIDVNPGSGKGYTGGSNPSDSWGRKIGFGNGFAIDYEIYFWWSGSEGKITADNFNTWTGNGWNYASLSDVGAKFAYTGNSSTGLRTLEIAIPWSALGGKHAKFALISWITGGDGSSAVDSAPADPAINYSDINSEWTDTDIFTNLKVESWFLMPDLTAKLVGPSVIGLNRAAEYKVIVENEGSLAASNVSVDVYVNGSLIDNWTVNLSPNQAETLNFTWVPHALGVYNMTVIVNKNHTVPEANTKNNEFSMLVKVVWIGKIDVDGNPDDWPNWTLKANTFLVKNGYFIWKDAIGDQRHINVYQGKATDIDQYLPGHSSAHADLTEVGVTSDDRYVYFLFKFHNMSNIKIGDNGATLIAVPIDFKKGGSNEFAAQLDTLTAIRWDIQFVVNLGGDQDKGATSAVVTPGKSVESLFYILLPNGSMITPEGAVMGVDLSRNTVEVRLPLSLFEGHNDFKFQVATGFSYGPAAWNFGNPFANDNIPDVVDTISPGPTLDAFTNNILDYYIEITMGNNGVESAKVTTIQEEMRQLAMNTFFAIARHYSPKRFEQNYETYLKLMQEIKKYKLSESLAGKLENINSEVEKLRLRYELGMKYLERYGTLTGAIRVYSANLDLNRIVERLQNVLKALQTGELEREEHMKQLAKELTKKIDGKLNDWHVPPVAVNKNGSGLEGASLKALYVDYDNNFLYIALTTNNKVSWRVTYGIALDYKKGGYTTGEDSWGKKISFTRGIDAELYFFWNGPFFGSPGTNNITTAQLALWTGNGWKYEDLKWVGFYAYTGGSNGLQTLEIAIPWSALGGKPKQISIVAFIAGQGVGDSAVAALPDQPAVHDKPPSQEWTDADLFTEFVTISIS